MKILIKIIAYASNDATKIAIEMQRQARESVKVGNKLNVTEFLAISSLLITQLKYDITSEIVSPESWPKLIINDYEKVCFDTQTHINQLVKKLKLNHDFMVKPIKKT